MRRVGKVTSSGFSTQWSTRITWADEDVYSAVKRGQMAIKVVGSEVFEVLEQVPPLSLHQKHWLADPTSWRSDCFECTGTSDR